MRIDVLTLFPEMIEGPLRASLLGKAIDDGLLEVAVTNIRDFATDKHHTTDDTPYGGGPGMVMMCDPIVSAVESLRDANSLKRVVLLTPRGKRLDQAMVREFAADSDMVMICGRYEGVDERVAQSIVTDEVSIGDYVLSGGELPALVMIEAISRMIPGVVGDWESVTTDSFYEGLLGPPQYTRPAEFRGEAVPEILLSGHHAAIAKWRRLEAIRKTRDCRPDLLEAMGDEGRRLLDELETDGAVRPKENER